MLILSQELQTLAEAMAILAIVDELKDGRHIQDGRDGLEVDLVGFEESPIWEHVSILLGEEAAAEVHKLMYSAYKRRVYFAM